MADPQTGRNLRLLVGQFLFWYGVIWACHLAWPEHGVAYGGIAMLVLVGLVTVSRERPHG